MRVRVRFFASLADAAGTRELELDAEEGCTVARLWDILAQRYPRLAPHEQSLLRAVNEEFCRSDAALQEDDEVAFFPPVSGG